MASILTITNNSPACPDEADILQQRLIRAFQETKRGGLADHFNPLPDFIGSGKHLIKSGGKDPRKLSAARPRVLAGEVSPRVAAKLGLPL